MKEGQVGEGLRLEYNGGIEECYGCANEFVEVWESVSSFWILEARKAG